MENVITEDSTNELMQKGVELESLRMKSTERVIIRENVRLELKKLTDSLNSDMRYITEESSNNFVCDDTIYEDVKFKFGNNKKALYYKFNTPDSNDFTLGINNTSEWTFAPKQEEQKLNYGYRYNGKYIL